MATTTNLLKKNAVAWKALLADEEDIKHAVKVKIDAITAYLLAHPGNNEPGLLDGTAGISIYFAYLNAYEQTDKYNDAIGELLENSFGAINDQQVNAPVFCTGICGILWAMHLLNKEGFVDVDDYFEELMPLLINAVDLEGKNNNFDFLHGAGGVAFYLSHLQEHIDTAYIESFVKQLRENGTEDERTIKWLSDVLDGGSVKKVYNLSLSHGISSTIIILCSLQRLLPQNKEIDLLIKKALCFLRDHKKTEVGVDDSLFPNYLDGSVAATKSNSRLSWCYGDFGNALAILSAGQLFNDQQLIDEAIDIMLHNAQRRDLSKINVVDAGFCHGTSGISHIFNRFYQLTGREEFKEAALFWMKKTLEMDIYKDGIAGYKIFKGEEGWQNDRSVLEGAAGMGLALISAISDMEPKWDRCFLLS